MERTDPPFVGDERGQLEDWLDYQRATVHVKCEGLTDAQARRTPLPPSPAMSPIGLVNHLYWVERNWFERVLVGAEIPIPWLVRTGEKDPEFEVDPGETLAGVLARYGSQCARSRELAAGRELDSTSRHPGSGSEISLRWIYLHMIEETARHNGHFDVMRELIDGVRGD
jgi:hypothetical protein